MTKCGHTCDTDNLIYLMNNLGVFVLDKELRWRHDTQYNDIQRNDTKHKGLMDDTQHNNALHAADCHYAE